MLPVDEALEGAKSRFAEAVREGIDVLMTQCGFSRERATSALLRELARGEDRPQEGQLFEVMKTYGLGMEEASKALVVNIALQRLLNSGLNPADAIQQLATKLSISNLIYESSDEDPTSDDGDVPLRPGVRIEPVSSQFPTVRRITSTNQRKRPITSTVGKPSKSKTRNPGRSGITPTGRKRNIDEVSPSEDKKNTSTSESNSSRPRADSVTEAVDAKISSQAANSSSEGATGTSVVRSKRVHRTEEPETGTPATKRRIM